MIVKQTRERARVAYKSNCRACQLSRVDAVFRRKVAHAKFFRQQGEDTLVGVAASYHLNQAKLYNHAAKHLSTYNRRLTKRQQEERERQLRLYINDPNYPDMPLWEKALTEIIASFEMQLDEGKLNPTPNDFIAATRLKMRLEKNTDTWQRQQLIKMLESADGAKR